VIDVNAREHAELRETILGIYVPRYGESWAEMLDGGAAYARIRPRRMLTFAMPELA
jgi:hypothetical protein